MSDRLTELMNFILNVIEINHLGRVNLEKFARSLLADGWARLADADLVEWCVTHDDRMVVPGECARDDYCYRYLKGLGPYPDECVSGGTVALVAFGGREQ